MRCSTLPVSAHSVRYSARDCTPCSAAVPSTYTDGGSDVSHSCFVCLEGSHPPMFGPLESPLPASPRDKATQAAIEQTHVWFGRAKAQPLSLFVHFDFNIESARDPLVYYLKGLTYHTAGLRHLGLSCSEVIYLLPHLQETKTTYPNLKSLDLICTSETIHAEGGGVPLTELDVFNGSHGGHPTVKSAREPSCQVIQT